MREFIILIAGVIIGMIGEILIQRNIKKSVYTKLNEIEKEMAEKE